MPHQNFLDEKLNHQIDLVKKVQKGCSTSLLKLLDYYNPLIVNLTNKSLTSFPNIPLDRKDIEQEIIVIFWQNVMNYDFNSKSFFPSYVKKFTQWGITTYLRKFTTNSYKTLNYASSFLLVEDSKSEGELLPTLDISKATDELFTKKLNVKEKKLLSMIDKGTPQEVILEKMHISKSTYYYLKNKIGKKI